MNNEDLSIKDNVLFTYPESLVISNDGTITLPPTIKAIGDGVFNGYTSLKKVILLESILAIGKKSIQRMYKARINKPSKHH